MEKLVLIDGNSLLNRAFYATPVFTTKNGLPTNGVFGFVKLMLKIIADKQPTYFAVAFDLHAPTFRHKAYSEYKAGRKPMPPELAAQVPILKETLGLMGVKTLELVGYEADDLLGTMAKKFDVQTFIYTGDRDAYQLVDNTTTVCFTKRGVSDLLELSCDNFQDEIGLTPAQIIDLKALMGDKSDNIPGVAGVGEKTAMGLLATYSDLDGVYQNVEKIGGALYNKLVANKENAYFSKMLATINTEAPLDIALCDCYLKTPFSSALKEQFAALEFKSLLALDIFEKSAENGQESNGQSCGEVELIYPSRIEEALAAVLEAKDKTYAVDYSGKELRFTALKDGFTGCESGVEYVFPIRENLLDTGYFESELTPIFTALFAKNNRVIVYNAKDIMHALSALNVPFDATFEDVAIMKCLSDGLSNTDGLSVCITQNGLPENTRAYALACLYIQYHKTLSEEERKLYAQIELPLVRVLFDMEKQGVCVNGEELARLSEKYAEELAAIKTRIYMYAGEEFNVNSTQQLGKILFEKLKIGSGKKKNKDSKSYKTTAEELEKYADESEIVREILRYRKVQKLHSTYIEGFKPLVKSGKVHTTYNQNNTATGRLSSANPNLQNIPIRTEEGRELRKLFTASDGNVLIDADYSQIELRLLAHFSGCKSLIQAYCEGADIHALTASQVFDVPLDGVTPKLRYAAKAVNFGIIYGISSFGLSNDLNISPKKAQEYIQKYFERYPEVKAYMNANVENATRDGYVKTLLGRRRVINEIRSSNWNIRSFGERAAMNMPLQGTSADIIKLAMINVYNKLNEGGFKAKLVLQVHDELVIDCPKSEVDAVKAILKTEMENAVSLLVPLTVELGVGDCWYETK